MSDYDCLSFRTYHEVTEGPREETLLERNARHAKELAMRYIDQANTSLRLAKEALQRAHQYEGRE